MSDKKYLLLSSKQKIVYYYLKESNRCRAFRDEWEELCDRLPNMETLTVKPGAPHREGDDPMISIIARSLERVPAVIYFTSGKAYILWHNEDYSADGAAAKIMYKRYKKFTSWWYRYFMRFIYKNHTI